MTRAFTLLALALMVGYLGILAEKIATPDLVVVIVLTAGLAAWDLLGANRKG